MKRIDWEKSLGAVAVASGCITALGIALAIAAAYTSGSGSVLWWVGVIAAGAFPYFGVALLVVGVAMYVIRVAIAGIKAIEK